MAGPPGSRHRKVKMEGLFEKHFQQWRHESQQGAKARQEENRLATLIRLLQEDGYTVKRDECYLYVILPLELTITMDNARELPPEKLLEWVKGIHQTEPTNLTNRKEDLAILESYQDGLDPLEEQWQLESMQEALAQQENYQDGLDPLED